MRIFIALLFDEEQKSIMYDLLQEVRYISKQGKFTDQSNLHLTLVYIGETSPEELEELYKKLSLIRKKQFNYMTNRIKYFKKSNNQKIVYLGVDKSDPLMDLYNEVVTKLRELNYDFHHNKLTPHITLGKKVIIKDLENVKTIYCNPLELKAKKISIMESKRVNGRLVYEELYGIALL